MTKEESKKNNRSTKDKTHDMLRNRRQRSTPSNTMNPTIHSPVRSKSRRLPLMLAVFFGLAVLIAFCTFYMSTLDMTAKRSDDGNELRLRPSNNNNNVNPVTKIFRDRSKYAPASDKTYKAAKKGTKCKKFDHGDISPTPNVKSLFNCNSDGGKCKWHHPARFFDETCGIGRDFADQIDVLKTLHANNELWVNGPPIVLPWAAISPKIHIPNRKEPFPTHNLSMTHVHKTGGTSLVNAFGAIIRKGAQGKRHTVYQPPRYPKIKPKTVLAQSRMRQNYNKQTNASSTFLNGAVKYQSDWGTFEHTLFAVVRDPAERFISAIGQATGAFGSSQNGVGKQLLNECLKPTSKKTLDCFVDLVKNNSTLIEVHFTPMVLEISFATMWKDIPVAVFPFSEVPTLMYELGSDPGARKKDGHAKGYRKDFVLTNMTYHDYDDESLAKLCDVYMMDVLFLNHIGYESRCDSYVTKREDDEKS